MAKVLSKDEFTDALERIDGWFALYDVTASHNELLRLLRLALPYVEYCEHFGEMFDADPDPLAAAIREAVQPDSAI